VDHSVAVAAKQGEVADSCFALTGFMERLNMVAFDIAVPPVTIDLPKVETACFAGQWFVAAHYATNLSSAQSWVGFAFGVEAPQVPALQDATVFVLLELRGVFRRVVQRVLEQLLRNAVHDVGGSSELIHNLLVPLTTVGTPLSPVVRRRGKVVRLSRYAILVPEAAQPLLDWVQGHMPEDAGQFDDAFIPRRQRPPIVLKDQVAR
jgi:hypothetical protein